MNKPQNVVALRVAVCVAVMAAAVAALRESGGTPQLWGAVLVGLPASFAIGYAVRATRPLVLRIGQSVIAIAIMVKFLSSIHHVGDLGALQVPLAHAFLWLLLLHALDTPNRRGLLVLLVASLVLIALAGVLSISMAIAPWLVVWAFASLVALRLGYRAELEELPSLGSAPPARFGPATLAIPAAILASVLLIGFGVFMLVPVAGTDRAVTFPAQLPDDSPVHSDGQLLNPSLGASSSGSSSGSSGGTSRASFGYFGFSNQLDTSLRGRPDDTLVMRVRASSPDFWRGQTFDVWDGRVWRLSNDRPSIIRGTLEIGVPRVPADGPTQAAVDVDELVQTYYLDKAGPNTIFGANQPNKVYFPERTLFQNQDGTLRAGVRLDPGTVYTVVSERPLVTPTTLRTVRPERTPIDIQSQYAASPVTTDRVRALAHRITASAPTPYDKVVAIEQWLARNTKYSLNIPRLPRGKDAVDQYLFVDKRGFCEQIGTSLVVMLRELGIPARLAVGYTPGERNPFTGLYEVKASDAHAWAEVYFPGIGWQGFDPTASVPLAGDSQLDAAGSGALSYLSAHVDIPGPLLAAISIAAGLVGFLFALRSVQRRPRRAALSCSWASQRLARLETLGAKRGRPRAPNETTPTYVRALGALAPAHDQTLVRIGSVIDAAMFAPESPAAAVRAEVDACLREVETTWSEGSHPADLVPSR
ncbi:MAG: transglutaminase family protein [Acidimicrobiia bacterium]